MTTFPMFDGECLSWDIGLYSTAAEEHAGFPRCRAVIRAMKESRPEQLARERRELVKATFCLAFGHNASRLLAVIEEELERGPVS